MKIKTLAIVVLSALSLSSTAALAAVTTVMVGQFTLKGRLLTQLVRLMPALLIKPFSWARFVPLRWTRMERPALLSVLTFS